MTYRSSASRHRSDEGSDLAFSFGPAHLLLEAIDPRVHLRGDEDGTRGVFEDDVDDAPRRSSHGDLDRGPPRRGDDSEQFLDDPCLDAVSDRRTRVRVDSDGEGRAEHPGQGAQNGDARFSRSGEYLAQVPGIDAGGHCEGPRRDPGIATLAVDVADRDRCRGAAATTVQGPGALAAECLHPRST